MDRHKVMKIYGDLSKHDDKEVRVRALYRLAVTAEKIGKKTR